MNILRGFGWNWGLDNGFRDGLETEVGGMVVIAGISDDKLTFQDLSVLDECIGDDALIETPGVWMRGPVCCFSKIGRASCRERV